VPLTVGLFLALPASSVTQETTGGVRGRLHSAVTGPVASAYVIATSPDLLGERRAVSATDGVFEFLLLPPGMYALRVRAIGHRPLVIQDVEVRLGRITGLGEVALEAAAVELGELTITAPTATLDPVRTTVGATLTADDYALLPAERDFKSLITILPHVNASYHGDPVNAGGSTGLENAYFVDGVNVTSPFDASGGTNLPYNFVRAVEVKVGGYEAQYGRALGAVVNAVTYSGTNHFEAEIFGFLTHDALAADPKAQVLRETGTVGYDVGARASGPLVRDRLWFSAALNPRLDRVDKELPALGAFRDERVSYSFAGKLTWRTRPWANVEFSVFGDPTVHHQVAPTRWAPNAIPANPDPFLTRFESGGITGSLRATAALGTQGTVEATLTHGTSRQSSLAETELGRTTSQFVDYTVGQGLVEGGLDAVREVVQSRTAAALRGSLPWGRHMVVAGGEYEDTRVSNLFTRPDQGVIWRFAADDYVAMTESTSGTFHNLIPTAYLQDSWRTSDRLTLSVGVRWSSQFLKAPSGGTAQRVTDGWQPRVGFSWQMGARGAGRLFGSYGRFYQQLPLFLSSVWYVDYFQTFSYYRADPRVPGTLPDSVIGGTISETDVVNQFGRIPDLTAENFDEFTLGFEYLLGSHGRVGLRGIRRDLRSSFQWGIDPSSETFFVLGTPGQGDFDFLPPPKRQYTALEATVDGSIGRVIYRASYVLSRTWGNYTGLYSTDSYLAQPGGNDGFAMPHQAVNSTGLLPNDRTHVLKLVAAYRPFARVAVGTVFTWQSGTPLNDFGPGPFGPSIPLFVAPRGSIGRTPGIWDLNLRLAYSPPCRLRCRLLVDALHVGNPGQVVRVDQVHYMTLDAAGQPSGENPAYLDPIAYQPPMLIRLGAEVGF